MAKGEEKMDDNFFFARAFMDKGYRSRETETVSSQQYMNEFVTNMLPIF